MLKDFELIPVNHIDCSLSFCVMNTEAPAPQQKSMLSTSADLIYLIYPVPLTSLEKCKRTIAEIVF